MPAMFSKFAQLWRRHDGRKQMSRLASAESYAKEELQLKTFADGDVRRQIVAKHGLIAKHLKAQNILNERP